MPEFKLIEKLLYKSEQNDIEAEFLIGNETLWASQKVVAEIFGTSSQNISKHFIKIIEDEKLEKKEVSISSKKLFENQQLDIMFLCDCTGSMQTYINSVKSELKNIIDFILENNPYADIKISFVGYRDISDKKRFEIIECLIVKSFKVCSF